MVGHNSSNHVLSSRTLLRLSVRPRCVLPDRLAPANACPITLLTAVCPVRPAQPLSNARPIAPTDCRARPPENDLSDPSPTLGWGSGPDRLGRSGRPDPPYLGPGRQNGSVGRGVPTKNFRRAARGRGSVGRVAPGRIPDFRGVGTVGRRRVWLWVLSYLRPVEHFK